MKYKLNYNLFSVIALFLGFLLIIPTQIWSYPLNNPINKVNKNFVGMNQQCANNSLVKSENLNLSSTKVKILKEDLYKSTPLASNLEWEKGTYNHILSTGDNFVVIPIKNENEWQVMIVKVSDSFEYQDGYVMGVMVDENLLLKTKRGDLENNFTGQINIYSIEGMLLASSVYSEGEVVQTFSTTETQSSPEETAFRCLNKCLLSWGAMICGISILSCIIDPASCWTTILCIIPIYIFCMTQCRDLDDTDQDGILDEKDNCPTKSNSGQQDADADQIGDVCDNCPTVNNINQADRDKDNYGDLCDNCPIVVNDQSDKDKDGVGDLCDNCKDVPNPNQADTDSDKVGDLCDNCVLLANSDQADQDKDGVGNGCDNCPNVANPDQKDSDGDKVGDLCEPDKDGDKVIDDFDLCPNDSTNDIDNDGYCVGNGFKSPKLGGNDNCPAIFNPDQSDIDGDLVGDLCDNCPEVTNPDQKDSDGDKIGDLCETE